MKKKLQLIPQKLTGSKNYYEQLCANKLNNLGELKKTQENTTYQYWIRKKYKIWIDQLLVRRLNP